MRDALPLNAACSLVLKALRNSADIFFLIISFIAFFIKTKKKKEKFILTLQRNKSEIQISAILTLITIATVADLIPYLRQSAVHMLPYITLRQKLHHQMRGHVLI